PRARILKKHCATSSINSATGSAVPPTAGIAAVLRRTRVLCRIDVFPTVTSTAQASDLTPWLSIFKMTPKLSLWEPLLLDLAACAGAATDMKPPVQQTDTGTAGVIARPPLPFLPALLLGFILDRLLPAPFAVPGTSLVQWI